MDRERVHSRFLTLYALIAGLTLFPFLAPLGTLSAAGDPTGFELLTINGEDARYLSISPTDGDILDRGLRTLALELTFRSNRGEWVNCYDRDENLIEPARGSDCVEESGRFKCFTVVVDTRKLPNGPNRLSFRLFDSPTPGGELGALLDEITLIVHVQNNRLKVERQSTEALRVRLEAGVMVPAAVRGYRFALFAASSKGPRIGVPAAYRNGSETGVLPVGGPGTNGIVQKMFPLHPNEPHAAWPEGELALSFNLNWTDLAALSRTETGPRVVYLTAAVFDGTRWEWTSAVEVTEAAPGAGLTPIGP